MKLGFAGLGQMGKPIALNLLKSGAELVVIDRTDQAFAAFKEKGARGSTNVADLAGADVVFLCLPNAKVVQNFVLGEGGLVGHLKPGQIVVDLSTITLTTSNLIASELASKGVAFLDAPISGMESRAVDGTLTVMCGGARETFDLVKPLLDHIGNKILFMGPAGSGQLTKLINQLLFDINAAALGEILPMAVKMGLDPDLVGEVINSGTGRSYASEFFIPRILRRRFNQSAEIARPLARMWDLDYLPDALVRRRATETQAGKSGTGRRRNVAAAFEAPQARVKQIEGRRIVLIDDVMTTGATLEGCARALLKAGAACVDVAVVSRVKEAANRPI